MIGVEYIRKRWANAEAAIRKAFDGQEWVDEGYGVENAVRRTRDGVEGRPRPQGMRHVPARSANPAGSARRSAGPGFGRASSLSVP
ncbi:MULTISPECIES: hypothetical protein [unclassified Streptomyces]|uniref:hypothetical protein n=1 Tax=unclassified Streptomyces TaxID=2593676 RepID=UPI002E2AA6A6|nr:hypothetical protein [Streptomyces sp. NBC_00223]